MKDRFGKGLGQLKSLRDEIKVKLKRAGAGAKEQWEEIEPSLQGLEEKLGKQFERTGEKVAVGSKALVEELGEAFKRVRDRLSNEEEGDDAADEDAADDADIVDDDADDEDDDADDEDDDADDDDSDAGAPAP
jgi:hypothetical protein